VGGGSLGNLLPLYSWLRLQVQSALRFLYSCGAVICSFNKSLNLKTVSRRSSVSIVARLRVWTTGVHFSIGEVNGFFSSPPHPDRLWVTPTLLSGGSEADPSPGIMLPGCEADHSLLYSAQIKNAWSYTSTSHTSSWRVA
jgi:hypothetical protein